MKTNKYKSLFLLIIALPIIFLTSCGDLSDDDWELVEVAFESWAEENDLIDNGEWKPDGVVKKAVNNTIADITNQDEFVELDGLDVIRDIERADQLASEGLSEWDRDKLHDAEILRPKDWRIQEQNAIVKFDSGSSHWSFGASDDLIEEQIYQGGNCVQLRRQQLEYREALLSSNLNTCSSRPSCSESQMKLQMDETLNELVYIRDKGNSIFCDQIKP